MDNDTFSHERFRELLENRYQLYQKNSSPLEKIAANKTMIDYIDSFTHFTQQKKNLGYFKMRCEDRILTEERKLLSPESSASLKREVLQGSPSN
jgi:hypothetical protein